MAVRVLLFFAFAINAIEWVTFPGHTYRFSTSTRLVTSLSSEILCGQICEKNVHDATAAVYDFHLVWLSYFFLYKRRARLSFH